MTLPASFFLQQYPGVARWLGELEQTGYARGVDLVEGDYLAGVSDAGSQAECALLALERDGRIRRGSLHESFSQRAWASLGGMATVSRGKEPPTWFAWHPACPKWRHPLLVNAPRKHSDDCLLCDEAYPRKCSWHVFDDEVSP